MIASGALTVSQVAGYLKELLEYDDALADVWIFGEVSNVTTSTAGHTYLTLKDAHSQLRAVIFRQQGTRQAALLRNGMSVLAHGRISFYEASGTCQLYIEMVQPAGIGALFQRLEAVKARLLADGLCDDERKRPLPPFPRRIGIVTSPQAAALQDILRVLQSRFPAVEVVLSPTLVQGDTAAPQIVAALQRLNRRPDIDVIIVARGGGSLEDLWPFNDEQVARTVAASPQPVVTGVGHETDITMVDLVADLRAPTPSAAAAAVVPDWQEVAGFVQTCRQDLTDACTALFDDHRESLQQTRSVLTSYSPLRTIPLAQQCVSGFREATVVSMRGILELQRETLRGLQGQIAALGPHSTLDRGYSIVTRVATDGAGGQLVSQVGQVTVGDRLRVRVADGSFEAVVVAGPGTLLASPESPMVREEAVPQATQMERNMS